MANIILKDGEKKKNVTLKVKEKYIKELKAKNVNMSRLFEEKIEEFLKK